MAKTVDDVAQLIYDNVKRKNPIIPVVVTDPGDGTWVPTVVNGTMVQALYCPPAVIEGPMAAYAMQLVPGLGPWVVVASNKQGILP